MRPLLFGLAACALLACGSTRNDQYAPVSSGSRRDPGPFVGTGSDTSLNPGTSISDPAGRRLPDGHGKTTVSPNDSPIPRPAMDPAGSGGTTGSPSSIQPGSGTPGRALPVSPPGAAGMPPAPNPQPL